MLKFEKFKHMSRSFSWSPRNIGAKLSFRSRFDNRLNDYIVPSIIGANALVFSAWQMSDRSLNRWLSNNFTVTPHRIVEFHTSLHTLVTSFFSHRDIFHLLANMITLYAFGNSTVVFLGASRFLTLYVSGGIVSNLSFCLWPYLSQTPNGSRSLLQGRNFGRYETALGASGAISAVVMWSVCANPWQKFFIIPIPIPIPAIVLGVGFVLKDIHELNYQFGGRTANIGHLGGAAFGIGYFFLKRFR